jgi:hypothetical protein
LIVIGHPGGVFAPAVRPSRRIFELLSNSQQITDSRPERGDGEDSIIYLVIHHQGDVL